jgi:hypothetical protein
MASSDGTEVKHVVELRSNLAHTAASELAHRMLCCGVWLARWHTNRM